MNEGLKFSSQPTYYKNPVLHSSYHCIQNEIPGKSDHFNQLNVPFLQIYTWYTFTNTSFHKRRSQIYNTKMQTTFLRDVSGL